MYISGITKETTRKLSLICDTYDVKFTIWDDNEDCIIDIPYDKRLHAVVTNRKLVVNIKIGNETERNLFTKLFELKDNEYYQFVWG